MPFFSRPLDFGSIDRFDNGTGRFALPLQYHRLFFFVINLTHHLRAKRFVDTEGHVFIRTDPAMVELLAQYAMDLMAHIAAASHGGILPDGVPITSLRTGSLEELGLLPPPILLLFLYLNGTNPLAQQNLPVALFDQWADAFRAAATETREWLTVAQRRSLLLGDSCKWNWKVPSTSYALRKAADDGMDAYSPLRPYFSTDPRTATGRVQDALVLYQGPPPSYTAPASGEPSDDPPTGKTSTALIPHPIYGPGAQNALVPYQSQPPPPTSGTAAETSTALIPHPIYGPGAQNALIPYRPPTPYPGLGIIAPPNTIVDEDFDFDSDSSFETDSSTASEDYSSDSSSYATARDYNNQGSDDGIEYYDVVDVGVQTEPVYSDSEDSMSEDDADSIYSDSKDSMPELEYVEDPRNIIDLTLDDD
ncbi:hypothetical protein K466DRAFT_570316 [Polyporus arcularius HHB13444]|uniref:Uncharacterized protein n=1 Tax=Polyporus arcularius HHB13444 TaxID=1314778 RepID=A0A5C3NPQ9_9APHY|nr:hypothetical protein K466DRAFT_570316 [Polyporus arcularius HHB13444]